MSSERVLAPAIAALAQTLAACAISLDPDPAPPPGQPDEVPALESCPLFDDDRGLSATGRVRSFASGDRTFLVADALRVVNGDGEPTTIEPAVFEAGTLDVEACLRGVPATLPARGALDASALGDDVDTTILSTFVAGARTLAYVHALQGFELVGVALAEWDDAAGAFIARGEYLFTGDRPAYGDAALVVGDTVYAYGCREIGFLTDACYVARVPADRADDPTAYEFYQDGGGFGADPDDAWPIFEGGRGLAITSRGDRVYAAYATPLGRTLHVRSGLGPTGPWSAPVQVTRCELPDDAFCGGVAAHPLLEDAPDQLALTYAVSSFDELPDDAARARLVIVPLDELP
jgi:hypothetical protein